jgi:hypothetical protein
MTDVLSGVLPAGTYHQASTLGEGSFGAVVAAFDDDGGAWALKIFAEDEDDGSFDASTVREVSMLRLLRGANGHANILAVHDIRVADSKVVMAMPRLEFDLERAISGRAFVGKKNRVRRVKIAHGVLSAVAFLADNGIMHRDIKCDNVMLTAGTMEPVLIDFSLAKFDTASGTVKAAKSAKPSASKAAAAGSARKHSGNVGTATYTAPEVYAGEAYGCGADVWSVGVVLLELMRGEMLGISRDKAAFRAVAALLDALPTDKPMPALLRTLLVVDPAARSTARAALAAGVFSRAGLAVPAVRAIEFERALAPRGGESCAPSTPPSENAAPKGANRAGSKSGAAAPGTTMEDWCVAARRLVLALGGSLPQPLVRTVSQCAATYMATVASLGLIDGADDAEYLMHCVVLACKLLGVDEGSVARLAELEVEEEEDDDDDEGAEEDGEWAPATGVPPEFAQWDLEEFTMCEAEMLEAMDFCGYTFAPLSAAARKALDGSLAKGKKGKKGKAKGRR